MLIGVPTYTSEIASFLLFLLGQGKLPYRDIYITRHMGLSFVVRTITHTKYGIFNNLVNLKTPVNDSLYYWIWQVFRYRSLTRADCLTFWVWWEITIVESLSYVINPNEFPSQFIIYSILPIFLFSIYIATSKVSSKKNHITIQFFRKTFLLIIEINLILCQFWRLLKIYFGHCKSKVKILI